jgi:hypothetical protein
VDAPERAHGWIAFGQGARKTATGDCDDESHDDEYAAAEGNDAHDAGHAEPVDL